MRDLAAMRSYDGDVTHYQLLTLGRTTKAIYSSNNSIARQSARGLGCTH